MLWRWLLDEDSPLLTPFSHELYDMAAPRWDSAGRSANAVSYGAMGGLAGPAVAELGRSPVGSDSRDDYESPGDAHEEFDRNVRDFALSFAVMFYL